MSKRTRRHRFSRLRLGISLDLSAKCQAARCSLIRFDLLPLCLFFFLSNLCLATFLDRNSPLLISSIKEGGRAWANDIVSEAKIILLFVHETFLHDAHNCCVVCFQGSPPLMRRMAFRSSILVMYIHRLKKKRILHALLANVAANSQWHLPLSPCWI